MSVLQYIMPPGIVKMRAIYLTNLFWSYRNLSFVYINGCQCKDLIAGKVLLSFLSVLKNLNIFIIILFLS